VDLSIWNNNGSENVAGSLSKGDRVLVTGKLKMNQWQSDDGQNRTKLELLVSEIGPTLKWAEVDITKNTKSLYEGNGGQSSNMPPEGEF
jgi:single-strand DNA-binding protein